MDYKSILRAVWKRSKVSYLILAYSLAILLVFSFLRLGRHVLSYPRKRMEQEVRAEYEPTQEQFAELEWFAVYAITIFKNHTTDLLRLAYKGYDDYIVNEYREARYTILRKGRKVYVAIRGSTVAQNWADGLTSEIEYDDQLENGVHAGYAEVSKGIADRLSQYCKSDDEIFLTGGSMGGAVSILVGWYLDDRGYTVSKIWAFANPRVSDGDYGHLPIINVLNLKDPVVFMPAYSLFTRYRHQGKRLCLTRNGWGMYQDHWMTDLVTSSMFMDEKVDVNEHLSYADELLKLKVKLGY